MSQPVMHHFIACLNQFLIIASVRFRLWLVLERSITTIW